MTLHDSTPRGHYKGFAWELSRSLLGVGVSTVLGVLFGALFAVGLDAETSTVVIAGFAGGFVGLATSPALSLVMHSRDAGLGVFLVTLATGVASLACGWLVRPVELGWGVLATVGFYVAVCIVWRIWAGSGAWAPHVAICGRCGYDLRGLSSDRCPECGVRFERARVTPPARGDSSAE
jgi:hypothetical protein